MFDELKSLEQIKQTLREIISDPSVKFVIRPDETSVAYSFCYESNTIIIRKLKDIITGELNTYVTFFKSGLSDLSVDIPGTELFEHIVARHRTMRDMNLVEQKHKKINNYLHNFKSQKIK